MNQPILIIVFKFVKKYHNFYVMEVYTKIQILYLDVFRTDIDFPLAPVARIIDEHSVLGPSQLVAQTDC